MLVTESTEGDDRRLSGVDIADGEVQVELLWVRTTRPGRHFPVVDALEGQARAAVRIARRDATPGRRKSRPVAVGVVSEGPPEQIGVELPEHQGVGAVQDDQV